MDFTSPDYDGFVEEIDLMWKTAPPRMPVGM